jgi:ketosteroid isomerase-like protein
MGSVPIFTTAQDAENAFYESLERNDLELMMAVWAEDEEIVCVHPAGGRIAGQEQVRESWRRIFASGPAAAGQDRTAGDDERDDGRGA